MKCFVSGVIVPNHIAVFILVNGELLVFERVAQFFRA